MRRAPVLLVEDTPSIAMLLSGFLRRADYEVITASSALEGQARFIQHGPAVVLLDLRLPDGDGIALLKELKALSAGTNFIVITSDPSPRRALEASQAGAIDYLLKPVREDDLLNAVARAYSRNGRINDSDERVNILASLDALAGNSAAIQKTNAAIKASARSRAPVFLYGENGVGKARTARAIHLASGAEAGVFHSVNCTNYQPDNLPVGMPDLTKTNWSGLFGDTDTLFLENLSDLRSDIQTRLLSALETDKDFRARIICSTVVDPWTSTRTGILRHDLYYRLSVVAICLPPLRERGDDVLTIANRVIPVLSAQEKRSFTGMSAATANHFREYHWPGNIRQLVNVLWGIVVLNDGDTITPEMLPAHLFEPKPDVSQTSPSSQPVRALAEVERSAIMQAIDANNGSVPKAALQLGVSPSTLYRKLEVWNKSPTDDS